MDDFSTKDVPISTKGSESEVINADKMRLISTHHAAHGGFCHKGLLEKYEEMFKHYWYGHKSNWR
jgi:hypothetical protein